MQPPVVQVEDVQHQGLQCIGGDEPMVCTQHTALIVAPRLDLCAQGKGAGTSTLR